MNTAKQILYKIPHVFLLLAIIFSSLPLTSSPVFAYPSYPANAVITRVAPWVQNATMGVGNIGVGMAGVHYKEYCGFDTDLYNNSEDVIRQDGTITRVKLYTANVTNLTGFYIKIWRPSAAASLTCSLVGTSENLVASLATNTTSTIDLTSPISGVKVGDFVGYRIETSGNVTSFYARTGVANTKTNYVTDSTPSSSSFNWGTGTELTGYMIPIEVFMPVGPQFLFIGDSIIRSGDMTDPTCISRQFSTITGYTVQNMGIGGDSSTQILARFTRDAINLNPKVVVIAGGINDGTSSITIKDTLVANIKSMLDTCQATASIEKVILVELWPGQWHTDAKQYFDDQCNNSLASLGMLYSKVIICDPRPYVGLYRAGGATRNLWDYKAGYSSDTLHITSAEGRLQAAQAIIDSLSKSRVNWYSSSWLYRKTITVSRASGATNGISLALIINRSAGVDSGNTTYVGTKCNADYSDIMFTTADGTTPAGWWAETSTSNATSAYGWVDLGYVDTGATTFYMYYGNVAATTYSNGNGVFTFFDDFLGVALDAQWQVHAGDVAVAGGVVTVGDGASDLGHWAQFGTNTRTRYRIRTSQIVAGSILMPYSYIDANNLLGTFCDTTSANYRHWDVKATVGVGTDSGVARDTANYHIFDTLRNSTVSIVYQIDNASAGLNNTQVPTGVASVDFTTAAGAKILMDWYLIGKWLIVEPAWGTWGAEQNYPNAPSSLTITPQSGQLIASWVKGVGSNNTLVRYKGGSYPTDITDGTQVYYGTGLATPITGLSNGVTYYVRTWGETTTDGVDQYSSTTRDGTGTPGASGNTLYSSVVMAFIIAVGAVVLLLLISVTNVNDAIAIGVCGVILITILMSIWLSS